VVFQPDAAAPGMRMDPILTSVDKSFQGGARQPAVGQFPDVVG
jgi:hypothetical protein